MICTIENRILTFSKKAISFKKMEDMDMMYKLARHGKVTLNEFDEILINLHDSIAWIKKEDVKENEVIEYVN